MRLIPHDFDEQTKKWEEVIGDKLFMRPIYLSKSDEIEYSRVAKQFLGIHNTVYEMQEYLYTLTNSGMSWTLLFNHLPKEIDPEKRTEIVNILQMHQETPVSLNRFISFFAGKQLLPLMNTKYRNHFVDTLRKWLEQLEVRYPKLKSNQLQRIFLDFVKWSNYYFPKWLEDSDFENAVPRILWYGPMKESEASFVYFLYLFGFDVVIFEPDGKDYMKEHRIGGFPTEILAKDSELFDFPFDKPERVQTVTSQAQEMVQEHLYTDSALNYPWKYAEYETRTRILNTTYDEIFILSGAQLHLREGFADKEKKVYLPVLFTKVEGISADVKDYAQKLNQLKYRELTHIATKFPLLPHQKSNMQFHIRDASENGKLNPDKMMQLSIWPFKEMPLGAQQNIAKTMIRVIASDAILPTPGMSKQAHEQYLFGQMLLAPTEIMRLYQQFDYSFTNPTIVVFKEEQSGEIQQQDAILLVFLNMLGFDVLIFNPDSSRSIEHFIKKDILSTTRLEKVSFNETFSHLISLIDKRENLVDKAGIMSIIKRFTKNKK